RVALFALCDAYQEEKITNHKSQITNKSKIQNSKSESGEADTRTVLKLHPRLAPYKAAVFPLLANKPGLVKKAEEIYHDLQKEFMIAWDERGNIGKRYRAQDEAGTPYCLTVDFETLADGTVTVRDRDTMGQERIDISRIPSYLREKLSL
ncbi:MAG: His/Gly/Thr/Pro-type tRNA ligase C-terminal domain-containing protein, partial [Nanoarchaeota archaeon]|nr:His/Gly/Thr/Pro-type tRNA ligase C-terminal domain-containing protein [Nanoarchaeota archaeon]